MYDSCSLWKPNSIKVSFEQFIHLNECFSAQPQQKIDCDLSIVQLQEYWMWTNLLILIVSNFYALIGHGGYSGGGGYGGGGYGGGGYSAPG